MDSSARKGDPNVRWGALDLRSVRLQIGDPVSLIHHAFGGPKQVELLIGTLLELDERRLQYPFTARQPGSGGAPLFDSNWNVIGMHLSAGELSSLSKKGVTIQV